MNAGGMDPGTDTLNVPLSLFCLKGPPYVSIQAPAHMPLLQAAFLDPGQGHAVLFVLALQLPGLQWVSCFRAQACYQTRQGSSPGLSVWFWGSYTSFLSGFSSDQWE